MHIYKMSLPEKEGMYCPKNVLITGVAGFIASHMAYKLLQNPDIEKVIAIDKLDYCSSLRNIAPCQDDPRFVFIKGDVNSYDFMLYILNSYQVDTVMHFAAETHVDRSFQTSSTSFTFNNTHATHVLLETVRISDVPVKRIIYVSTDEVYGETYLQNPAFENHPINPTNPYAATKANAEMLCFTYAHCYQLPIIVTRGNNVYGPHQYPDKIIPKFIQYALLGKTIPVHGSGENYRSYLHVHDTVNAFYAILTKGRLNEVYNIGSDNYLSVLQVVRELTRILGQKYGIFMKTEHVPDRVYNDKTYCINCNKLKRLGWTEDVPFSVGLEKTIRWYMDLYDTHPHLLSL